MKAIDSLMNEACCVSRERPGPWCAGVSEL